MSSNPDDAQIVVGIDYARLRELTSEGPLDVDISDYGDEWCAGYLRGQVNMLDFLAANCESEESTAP